MNISSECMTDKLYDSMKWVLYDSSECDITDAMSSMILLSMRKDNTMYGMKLLYSMSIISNSMSKWNDKCGMSDRSNIML
jgi:hypothetical protein